MAFERRPEAGPEWLTSFQQGVSDAESPAACIEAFEALLARFDVSCFACGEVDLRIRERTIFYAIGWPDSWRRFYLESGIVERDPLIQALETRRAPFSWTEIKDDPGLAIEERRMFQVAANAGWTEGLVVPISRSSDRVGLVSLAASRPPFTAAEKAALTVSSVFFHQHIRVLVAGRGFPQPPAGLTEREMTCLSMVADGLSDREMGERLQLSTTTVHEHVEKAKRKLHARTRASAVAIAVMLGIVRC